jgi:hypothetical protein
MSRVWVKKTDEEKARVSKAMKEYWRAKKKKEDR